MVGGREGAGLRCYCDWSETGKKGAGLARLRLLVRLVGRLGGLGRGCGARGLVLGSGDGVRVRGRGVGHLQRRLFFLQLCRLTLPIFSNENMMRKSLRIPHSRKLYKTNKQEKSQEKNARYLLLSLRLLRGRRRRRCSTASLLARPTASVAAVQAAAAGEAAPAGRITCLLAISGSFQKQRSRR